jgi:hypothetical protein
VWHRWGLPALLHVDFAEILPSHPRERRRRLWMYPRAAHCGVTRRDARKGARSGGGLESACGATQTHTRHFHKGAAPSAAAWQGNGVR